jgi:protein SCO1
MAAVGGPGVTRLIAALAATALLAGCGGAAATTARHPSAGGFAGSTLDPPQPEQPVTLADYTGRRVDLRSYLGKPVLLTFLYTHCPDVCPAIAAGLAITLDDLGPAARSVHVVAVSADPRGDNRRTVAAFLRSHHLTGRIDYLIGNRAQLARVWAAWKVGATPEGSNAVAHSALVYGIGASGRVLTIYPANFRPSDIAHDVPKLAAM